MKVSIRRHGIVIRAIDVSGDRARIGSGEECEIRIDDPYLAAHVADLAKTGGEWRVVDAGASLEGLSREGSRVEDEPLQFDYPYSVGGFELVVDGEGMPRAAAAPPKPAAPVEPEAHPDRTVALPMEDIAALKASERKANVLPATVVEVANPRATPPAREVPKTMFEPAPVQPKAKPAAPELTFQPLAAPAASSPVIVSAPISTGGKGKRLRLIAISAVIVLLLLVVVAVSKKGPAKEAQKEPVKATPAPVEPTSAASTETPIQRGDRLAADLKLDEALTAWEAVLAENPQAELQVKYARTALDLARVHAAAHDDAKARTYFEKAAKYAPAESAEAKMAANRLK